MKPFPPYPVVILLDNLVILYARLGLPTAPFWAIGTTATWVVYSWRSKNLRISSIKLFDRSAPARE